MAEERLNLEGKNIYSVIFNQEAAWIYKPRLILDKVNQFMREQNVQDQITWDKYF
ncbi:hypothetical protein LCGC14_1341820 [marine sediment metagenome]|uniref:Uncharacterized protein n=1 Tax=marine sediment metagenome TaxID=412755 RepID=A0A0F9KE65_9ZZZZ